VVLRTCAGRTGGFSTLRRVWLFTSIDKPDVPENSSDPTPTTDPLIQRVSKASLHSESAIEIFPVLRLGTIRRNLSLQFTGKQTCTRDECKWGIWVITCQCETDRLGKNEINRC